jgi:hypothetical protein
MGWLGGNAGLFTALFFDGNKCCDIKPRPVRGFFISK